MAKPKHILAINGGSSSLKAAIFDAASPPKRIASVKIERIGSSEAILTSDVEGNPPQRQSVAAPAHAAALDAAMNYFRTQFDAMSLSGVGHRVVHGGPKYAAPQNVTPELLEELRKLEPFDPEHLPAQISLIELLMQRLPDIPHIACFDTAFHHDLPEVSKRLPIPRRFDAFGVRRYGFHGLSYSYLMEELRRIDPEAADGNVILAHLGNGASLAAVQEGKCIDTSMAFTPAAGIPMGTRAGDLDPGLVDYLIRAAGITVEQFNHIVHLESGLLGISETNADMQRLLELESTDTRAAEAVAIFCYQLRKWIGAYAAALGGLETLIFSGGIGEHAPEIRRRVCDDLQFLGIDLDASRNRENAALISSGELPVKVRVIATDEERMIARQVQDAIGHGRPGGSA
jgi:acetate kinase